MHTNLNSILMNGVKQVLNVKVVSAGANKVQNFKKERVKSFDSQNINETVPPIIRINLLLTSSQLIHRLIAAIIRQNLKSEYIQSTS